MSSPQVDLFFFSVIEGIPRPQLKSSHPNCRVWFSFFPQDDISTAVLGRDLSGAGWTGRSARRALARRASRVGSSAADSDGSVGQGGHCPMGPLQMGGGFREQQFTSERARSTAFGNQEETGLTQPQSRPAS